MLGANAGVLATVIGSTAALAGIIFKAGQWKHEMEEQHKEQSDAHKMVHRDVEKILEQMDEKVHSNRTNCPTCSDD